jgi:hypothetical protein
MHDLVAESAAVMTVPFLPDELDSNARVEVQVDGTPVGTRRAINFTGATSSGDDGLNEVVTVGFTIPSLNNSVVLTNTVASVTVDTNESGDITYSDALNPRTWASLSGAPADLGLSYALDDSTAEITATTDGVWAVTAEVTLADVSAPSNLYSTSVWFSVQSGLMNWQDTNTTAVGITASASGIVFLPAEEYLRAAFDIETTSSTDMDVNFYVLLTRLA